MAETHSAAFLEEFMVYFVGKQAEGWDYQRAIKEFVKLRKTKVYGKTQTVTKESNIDKDLNEEIMDNVPDKTGQKADVITDDDSIIFESNTGTESPESECAEYVTIESTSSPEPEEITNEPDVLPEAGPAPFLCASKAFKLSTKEPDKPEKKEPSKLDNGMINFNKVAVVKIKRLSKRRIEKYTQRSKKRPKLNARVQVNSSEENLKHKKKLKSVTNKHPGSNEPKLQSKPTEENKRNENIPEEICKSPDLSLTHSADLSTPTNTNNSDKQTTSSTANEVERIPVSKMKRIPKKTRTSIENEGKENDQREWVQVRDLMHEVNESENVQNRLVGNGLVKYVKKSPLRRESDCSFELGVFLKEIQSQIQSGVDVTSPPGGHRAYAKKIKVKEEEHKKRLKRMRFENRDRKRQKPYDRKSFGNSNKEPIGSRKSAKPDGRKRLLNLDGNNKLDESHISSKRSKYDDNKMNELDKIVNEKRVKSFKHNSDDTNRSDKRRNIERMLKKDSTGTSSDRRSHRGDERKSNREDEFRKTLKEKSQLHEERILDEKHRKTSINRRREMTNRSHETSRDRRRDISNVRHRESSADGRSDYSEKRDNHRPGVVKDDRVSNSLSKRDSSTRNGKEENSRSLDRRENRYRSSSNERRRKSSAERSMDVRKSDRSDRYSDLRSKNIRNDHRISPARRHSRDYRLSPTLLDKESSRSSSRVSDHLEISDRRPSSEYDFKDKSLDSRRRDRVQDLRSIYHERSRKENSSPSRASPYGEKKHPRIPDILSSLSPPDDRTSSSPVSFNGRDRDESIEKLITENQNLIKENRKFISPLGRVTNTEERRSSRSIGDYDSHTDNHRSSSSSIRSGRSHHSGSPTDSSTSIKSSYTSETSKLNNERSNHQSSSNIRSDRRSHHSGSPTDSSTSIKSSYTSETSKLNNERSNHQSSSSSASYLPISPKDWLNKRLNKMGLKKS